MDLRFISLLVLLSSCFVLGYHGQEFDEERDVSEDSDWTKDSSEEEPMSNASSEEEEEGDTSSQRFPDYTLSPDSLPVPDITVKLNGAVDEILDALRWAFTKDGEMVIPLKDISKPFGHGLLQGSFQASGGYFKNPASLRRTGDVVLSTAGKSVTLQAALGLSEVEAGYRSYGLRLLSVKEAGNVTARIAHNSLALRLSFTFSPECAAHLDYVRFDKLDGVNLDITGLGSFQGLFDALSTWLVANFEPILKTAVNQKLYSKLTPIIAKGSDKICSHIPHF